MIGLGYQKIKPEANRNRQKARSSNPTVFTATSKSLHIQLEAEIKIRFFAHVSKLIIYACLGSLHTYTSTKVPPLCGPGGRSRKCKR